LPEVLLKAAKDPNFLLERNLRRKFFSIKCPRTLSVKEQHSLPHTDGPRMGPKQMFNRFSPEKKIL
jgi:hypothetical protein